MLARTMARYVDPDATGPVIELGPGTGPVTEALVERGVDPARLVLVEFNPELLRAAAQSLSDATVVQGDAYPLRDSLGRCAEAPASAIVSGLPLVTKPLRDPAAPDCARLSRFDAGRAIRPVHLFGGAADPEIAAGRLHRSLRADLDEPAAGAGLGLSQGLCTRRRRGGLILAIAELGADVRVKILVIPGSLRTGSLNARLAAVATKEFALRERRCHADVARRLSAAAL